MAHPIAHMSVSQCVCVISPIDYVPYAVPTPSFVHRPPLFFFFLILVGEGERWLSWLVERWVTYKAAYSKSGPKHFISTSDTGEPKIFKSVAISKVFTWEKTGSVIFLQFYQKNYLACYC